MYNCAKYIIHDIYDLPFFIHVRCIAISNCSIDSKIYKYAKISNYLRILVHVCGYTYLGRRPTNILAASNNKIIGQ